eukprot:m.219437 g.219437  ORF g.219437 m.219437 type:complete len:890 (+) comp33293_c2_seq1:243-2912(+)
MADDENDDRLAKQKRLYQDILDDRNRGGVFYDKINKMIVSEKQRLIVNLNDIRLFRNEDGVDFRSFMGDSTASPGQALARRILSNPHEEIVAFQQALKDSVDNQDASYGKRFDGKFFVGLEGSFGSHHVTPRGLSARLLGKLVTVEGIVSRCSLIHPKVVRSVHYCEATEMSIERSYRDGTSIDGVPTPFTYPTEDENQNVLTTEYGLSVYKNHQKVTIQEMPERAPTGQLPRSVEVIIDDDLVDTCKPGDRVQMMGIYRAMPSKSNGGTSGVFQTALLCNNVRSLEREANMPTLTDVDIRNINKVAKKSKQTPFDIVSRSLAPSIFGNEHIKKALLCLLLGGEEKNLKRGGHIRGDINVLMVGDPSCGKSQMLRFIQNIAPHCLTTTGRGSSGVGLTAAVTTDQDTGERRLEAGAMVLADRGIVCIDEFDKMSDLDRVAIHEVMEQQTVTISKAGIHTSLNARCSVLAAANPVYGRYDPYQTPMENIGLPDSLLSRFDLLFIMLDKMEPEIDRHLAGHVLRSHCFRRTGEPDGQALSRDTSADVIVAEDPEDGDVRETAVFASHNVSLRGKRTRKTPKYLDLDFCKKYILYCKAKCHPVLTSEAASYIAERYAQLRSKETDSKSLPVTARTLECMIRLSTAYAKCRLSDDVEKSDAEDALNLVNFAYYNEAQKRNREDDEKHHDESSDDDDDDDKGSSNDGSSVSGSQQLSRKKTTPTTATTTKKAGGSTPSKGKGKDKGKGKADPFDFDDHEDDTTTKPTATKRGLPKERTTPAPKEKRPSSQSSTKAKPKAPAPAPTPAPEPEEEEEEEKVIEIVTTSPEQVSLVRDTLAEFFRETRTENTSKPVLLARVDKLKPNFVSMEQLSSILEDMQENNDVMVVDDQILKI